MDVTAGALARREPCIQMLPRTATPPLLGDLCAASRTRSQQHRHEFPAAAHAEPSVQVADVLVDRVPADPQFLRDLFVALAGKQPLQRSTQTRREQRR